MQGLLLLTLLLAGGYALYCHYQAQNIADSTLSSNWIVRGSLGNRHPANYDATHPTVLEPSLHICAVLLLLCLHCYLLIRHEKMQEQMDLRTLTPSDYTVQVSGLPQGLHVEELVERLSNQHSDRVAKVNLAYHISPFLTACRHLTRLKERLAELRARQPQGERSRKRILCIPWKVESVEEFEAQIQDQKAILAQMEADITQQFTGTAHVTFTEDEHAKAALRLFQPKKSLCPFKSTHTESAFRVKTAPDPSDLIWENLGVSDNIGFQMDCVQTKTDDSASDSPGAVHRRRSGVCFLSNQNRDK